MPSTLTIGQRFGKLQVVGEGEPLLRKSYRGGVRIDARLRCLCDCGGIKDVPAYQLRGGVVKSCGCLWRKHRLLGDEASFRQLFVQYRDNAKSRELEFALTPQSLRDLTSANCFYCGRPPSIPYRIRNVKSVPVPYIYNGVDRMNNSIGYVYGNCVPCCKVCNYMKRELSVDEFLDQISRIIKHKGVRHS